MNAIGEKGNIEAAHLAKCVFLLSFFKPSFLKCNTAYLNIYQLLNRVNPLPYILNQKRYRTAMMGK